MKARPLIIGILVGALALAGCRRNAAGGNILRMGVAADAIDSINFFVIANTPSFATHQALYPTLVDYDRNFKQRGEFAKSWDISPDGKKVTFHLTPNAKWSDGKALTSADPLWLCETILKYADGAAASVVYMLPGVTSCEAPDPTTFVINSKENRANTLLQFLSTWFILPKHVWEKHTGDNGNELKSYAPETELPMVAGGPYTITKYDKEGTTIFQKNPNFYGPEPDADTLAWQFFSNADAMVAALQAGELDVIYHVPPQAVSELKSNPNLVVETQAGIIVVSLASNSWPEKKTNRELGDPRVKEAFSRAISREKIRDVVYSGLAQPTATLLPTVNLSWGDPSIKPDTVDLARANEILDELGYRRGPDRIRVADGHKMAYEIITTTAMLGHDRVFEIIRDGLKELGVVVKQDPSDFTTWFEKIHGPEYERFDLAVSLLYGYPDPNFMLSTGTCASYGAWNYSGYCNEELDALYVAQAGELDADKRKTILRQIDAIVVRDRPYISLVSPDVLGAHSKQWTGFTFSHWEMQTSDEIYTGPRRVSRPSGRAVTDGSR